MALNRYLYTKKTKNKRYETPTFSSFKRRATDMYVFSREGDRLDLLSQEFYGDPRYWWVIAQFNQKPTESHFQVGDIYYVPISIEQILEFYRV